MAADAAALALRKALDGLVEPLARASRAFVRVGAWAHFGHARLDDHARERFGRSGRWVRDLAALGEAVESSPALIVAVTGADGGRPLGRVAAILIARAGLRDDIEDWIAYARRESVRELRAALRRAREKRGAGSGGAPPPGLPVSGEREADAGMSSPDAPASSSGGQDPDEDKALFRLPVPLPVLVAFDESLDLFRAVEGREASVTAFVEALIGEARAAHPVDTTPFVAPLLHGGDQARVEDALRRVTSAWQALPPPAACMDAAAAFLLGLGAPIGGLPGAALPEAGQATLASIGHSLRRFRDLERTAGQGDGQELDRQIRALIDLENDLEVRLSALLAEMSERGMWTTLGFANVGHYAEERLGLSRSRTGERVRLVRALRGLPRIAAACERGEISTEAAAIIHRLVGSGAVGNGAIGSGAVGSGTVGSAAVGKEPVGVEMEEAWVRHAASCTVKRLREEARALGRYRVRIDRGSINRGPNECGPSERGPDAASIRPLDDGAWHASLRREAGTTTARIIALGRRAAGLDAPAIGAVAGVEPAPKPGRQPEPDVFQLRPAEPDVFLRLRLPGDLAVDLVAAIEAARSDLEAIASASPWDEPWSVADPTPAQLVARIEHIRGRRLPTWVGMLALLEDFARTWDHDAGAPEGRDDSIFIRDGWRCAAPGCTSRRHLEDHHIVYRSQGGGDGHSNRVTLCRFHHQRGEHGGLMSVRGAAPLDLTWRLGRPVVAHFYRNERRIGAPGTDESTAGTRDDAPAVSR